MVKQLAVNFIMFLCMHQQGYHTATQIVERQMGHADF